MFHVGLDIHSTRISICVLNETGQVVHRTEARNGLLADSESGAGQLALALLVDAKALPS